MYFPLSKSCTEAKNKAKACCQLHIVAPAGAVCLKEDKPDCRPEQYLSQQLNLCHISISFLPSIPYSPDKANRCLSSQFTS